MFRKDLLKLIEEGEGLKVEFKQRFSSYEKIAKELLAFANTRCGFVLFGIDDDKSIYGVESEKGEAELIKETVENYLTTHETRERQPFFKTLKKAIVLKAFLGFFLFYICYQTLVTTIQYKELY